MIQDIRNYFVTDGKLEKDSRLSKNPKKLSVMDFHKKKNGYINPVIVTFQNGELNDGSNFNVALTANKNGCTNVSIETSYAHVFKGSDLTEKSRPPQIILVRNRKTNKIKLVEVDSAVLINSVLLNMPETESHELDMAKELRTLNKTFGGKKIVSRLEKREKLDLSSLPITDDVEKAIKDIKVEENISQSDTETKSFMHLLPACHRDAQLVSGVYILEEILSEEELQELQQEVATLDETKLNPQVCSPFFIDCYAEVKKTTEKLNTRLAGILFAETLIKFLKIPSKKLYSKNTTLCPFSSIIHKKLMNDFCVKTENSLTRPLTMRDKSLCHIIAVSLVCCDYKINLKLLSISTAEHLRKLSRLARAVGAVPLTKEENMFVLKLPLPGFPKVMGGRTRKK